MSSSSVCVKQPTFVNDTTSEWENNELYRALNFPSRKRVCEEIKNVIKSGADVNFSDRDGKTLLHLVATIPYCEWNAIQEVLNSGAEVNARDKDNRTPLHIAATYPAVNFTFIHELLRAGAEVNAKDGDGNTPLHLATIPDCRWSVIKKLFLNGAKLNTRNNTGNTPFHLAIKYRNADAASQLLTFGADFNIRDAEGSTPLHLALKCLSNNKIIKDLIRAGASINDRDAEGNSSVHLALGKDLDYIMTLVMHEGTTSVLRSLIQTPSTNFTGFRSKMLNRILVSHAPAPLEVDTLDLSLHDAAKSPNCNVHAMKEIILSGTKVNVKDPHCMTPLQHAVENPDCNADIFELLIKSGASVNVDNLDGNSPLQCAIRRHGINLDVVEILLNSGAKVGSRNRFGDTAFHCAIKNNVTEREVLLTCSKMLVKYAILQNEYLSQDFCLLLYSKFSELSSYKAECLSEVKTMKQLMLPNISLFDLVVKKGGHKEHMEELFYILVSHSFSIYIDNILEKVDKKFLINKVLTQEPLKDNSTFLKPDCVSYLANFLTKRDLFYLFIALMHHD